MTLRMSNTGEQQALSIMLNKTAGENLRLRLFTNNITPADTDVLATYTEASGSGYANVLLTAANWTVTAGDPASASYPEITFTFTGALGSVYGYYITGETSNLVRWAERFPTAPFDVQANGDQIKITPTITLKDTLDA